MSVRNQFLSGLKWTALGRVATQVVTWFITIYVMRLVAPEDYGLMALASIFSAFFGLVAEIGLGSALVRMKDVSPSQLRQIQGIVVLSNTVVFGLMAAAVAPFAAAFFDDQRLQLVIRVIALQFLASAFSVVPAAMLAREMAFRARAVVDFVSSLGGALLTLWLAYLGYGVFALAWGSVTSALLRTLGLNRLSPFHELPLFRFSGCGELFHFGRNVAQSQFIWFFYTQADSFIVGKLLGKHELGIYSVSMELASLPAARVSAILNQLAAPTLAKVSREGTSVAPYMIKGFRILGLFAFPVLWGISSVSPELIRVLIGETWRESVVPLSLLCLMMPLRILSVYLSAGVQAVGRADIAFRNICTTAVTMCIAFVVACRFGLVALSLTWVTVFPVVFWANLTRATPHLDLTNRDLTTAVLPSLVASSAMYACVAFVRTVLPWTPPTNLVMLVLTGVATYVTASFAINRRGIMETIDLIFSSRSRARNT